MKIINLTLLFLIVSLTLFAQDDEEMKRSSEVKITKSEAYPVVDAYQKMYYAIDGNSVLGVKAQGRAGNKFIFQVFEGANMNLKSSVTELIEEKGFRFEYIIEIKDKLYFFYSIYDKPNTTEQLFVRSINTKEGGFDSDAKLLVAVSKKMSGYSGVSGKFSIDVASNGDVFAIKYRYKPEEKDDSKNTDVIGMHVFDSNLEKVWNNDFVMPYTESFMDNLNFAVDSEGNGFFLIRKYKEEVSRKNNNDPSNQSLAILIAGAGGEFNEVEFSLGEYLIADVYMKENKNGDIICAGYYRKPKSYGIDGTFVSILDDKGNLSDPKLYEFSLDFIKKYKRISERGQKKMEKADENDNLSMSNLRMREVKVLADGGIVLAGEIFYITTYTDSKGNTHTTYHYDDVILVKINADGELGWMEKFPKNSTFESFRLMTSDSYSYVLFLDNIRNETMTDDGNIDKEVKGSYGVMAHRVDNKTGERKYLPLFDSRKIDETAVYQYSLNRVIALTDNSFAIELYIKKKSDMMFKVEFEE
jgi:hypothetical protein